MRSMSSCQHFLLLQGWNSVDNIGFSWAAFWCWSYCCWSSGCPWCHLTATHLQTSSGSHPLKNRLKLLLNFCAKFLWLTGKTRLSVFHTFHLLTVNEGNLPLFSVTKFHRLKANASILISDIIQSKECVCFRKGREEGLCLKIDSSFFRHHFSTQGFHTGCQSHTCFDWWAFIHLYLAFLEKIEHFCEKENLVMSSLLIQSASLLFSGSIKASRSI